MTIRLSISPAICRPIESPPINRLAASAQRVENMGGKDTALTIARNATIILIKPD
ncbi:hypothetical protein [Bradyrhizobium lablabi]|nr:hypothetical protein [Bradyrhizobium lablabi]